MQLREPRPDYRTMGDRELVERFKKEDSEAFGELYRRHFDYLVSRLMWHGHASRQAAEDVVSRAFLHAMPRIHQLVRNESDSAFISWMMVICRNGWIDLNKSKQLPPLSLDELVFIYRPDQQTDVVALHNHEQELISAAIREIVNGLNDFQRAMFVLRYGEQLPLAEIAKRLGRRVGAIKAGLFRVHEKFRNNPRLVELMKELEA